MHESTGSKNYIEFVHVSQGITELFPYHILRFASFPFAIEFPVLLELGRFAIPIL